MKNRIVLFIIVALAFVLRIYSVATVPPSLSWDEVSIGYNAYSIYKTGYDEHKRFMPLDAFTGYGDYKPPLSVYITVPFVALFGLNEFSVRLPSVLFGTLTVLLTYFLVKELFPKKLDKLSTLQTYYLPALSSLLLAISPWHINISRAGFEANIALFFVVLGTVLLLQTRNNTKVWYIAWLPYVAAIYTFNSSRYFVPIFSIGVLLYIRSSITSQIIAHKKEIGIGILIAFLSLVPIIPHIFSKEARLRFTEVNIFTNIDIIKKANTRIEEAGNSLISRIVDNRRVGFAREYFVHFFDHTEPSFLFIKGDGNPKFSIRDVGQMYLLDSIFFVIGIISLSIAYPSLTCLLLFWIVAAIIPAATARETPHALRILNSLPTWQIFTAYGMLYVLNWTMNSKKTRARFGSVVFCVLVSAAYIFNISYYIHTYYRHYPIEFAREWQYGYKDAIYYSESVKNSYKRIILTESIGRAYMYTLFYTRLNPWEYWKTRDSYFDAAGFYHVKSFGTYQFADSFPTSYEPDTLYIANPKDVPQNAIIQKKILLPDGEPILIAFTAL